MQMKSFQQFLNLTLSNICLLTDYYDKNYLNFSFYFYTLKAYTKIFHKLDKIDYSLTDVTRQYNHSERHEILNQHGETTFVNLSIPAYLSFSSQGDILTLSRRSILEVTGIIPYFYILSTGIHL